MFPTRRQNWGLRSCYGMSQDAARIVRLEIITSWLNIKQSANIMQKNCLFTLTPSRDSIHIFNIWVPSKAATPHPPWRCSTLRRGLRNRYNVSEAGSQKPHRINPSWGLPIFASSFYILFSQGILGIAFDRHYSRLSWSIITEYACDSSISLRASVSLEFQRTSLPALAIPDIPTANTPPQRYQELGR